MNKFIYVFTSTIYEESMYWSCCFSQFSSIDVSVSSQTLLFVDARHWTQGAKTETKEKEKKKESKDKNKILANHLRDGNS